MAEQLLTFEVRIKERISLPALGARVDAALNSSLKPSDSSMFRESEGLDAEALGLDVSLHYWPPLPEGEERTYRLIGYPAGDLKLPFDEIVDVSPFVLKILARRDSDQWYIPTDDDRYSSPPP
jgi:hypothetical protein